MRWSHFRRGARRRDHLAFVDDLRGGEARLMALMTDFATTRPTHWSSRVGSRSPISITRRCANRLPPPPPPPPLPLSPPPPPPLSPRPRAGVKAARPLPSPARFRSGRQLAGRRARRRRARALDADLRFRPRPSRPRLHLPSRGVDRGPTIRRPDLRRGRFEPGRRPEPFIAGRTADRSFVATAYRFPMVRGAHSPPPNARICMSNMEAAKSRTSCEISAMSVNAVGRRAVRRPV